MSLYPSKNYDHYKRALDLAISGLALVALAPLLLVIGVAVAVNLGRPVLFRQDRPGLRGRTLSVLKFRTMREVDETHGLISDSDRLTPFGSFLRSTSLDELPSLLNILKGEMSLIGPRPSLCRYLDLYTAEQNRRHDVLPGLTGLAQVNGRNALPWVDRLRMDVEYVDNRSLRLDLSIFIKTFSVVLRREGITTPGHVSSDEFLGSSAPGAMASAEVGAP